MDKCIVCGSTVGLRKFGVTVDDGTLNFAPHMCAEHGERFVFRVGVIMASLDQELDLAVGRPALEWARAIVAGTVRMLPAGMLPAEKPSEK